MRYPRAKVEEGTERAIEASAGSGWWFVHVLSPKGEQVFRHEKKEDLYEMAV